MKFAYDIPGYVQGHRFSNDALFYDATKERFSDLAGGDRFGQYVSKINGTPVFANRGANSRQGLYLDNTNQWQFPFGTPWAGSGLLVAQYNTLDGATSGNIWSHIFGEDTLNTNNSAIWVNYNFGTRTFYIWGAGSTLNQSTPIGDDVIVLIAWSRDQQDRIARHTTDGITVTASAAYNPSATNGVGIPLYGQPRCRLGNISSNAADTAVSTTGTMHIFEQHFWKGNILRDNLPDTKAFIDTLKTYYGIV